MATEKLSVCESIAAAIRRDIETGIIEGGEKLPSCREQALNLGINPNTVQKAYAILEKQSYIEVIPQKGAYAKKSPLNRSSSLNGDAERQITALKNCGLKKEKLIEIINKIYGESDD